MDAKPFDDVTWYLAIRNNDPTRRVVSFNDSFEVWSDLGFFQFRTQGSVNQLGDCQVFDEGEVAKNGMLLRFAALRDISIISVVYSE